jgi:hypothetical protein
MDEKVTMLDMEQKLAGDASGAYRDKVLASLADDRAAIRRAVDAGLPPADFEQANKVLQGIDAATKAVQTLWKTAHP